MPYKDPEKQKAAQHENYLRNKEFFADRQRRRRAGVKDLIAEARQGASCGVCGESDPRCLDFHHRDPSQKLGTVKKMRADQWSTQRILDELAKCDVLCANCHRKHHAPVW